MKNTYISPAMLSFAIFGALILGGGDISQAYTIGGSEHFTTGVSRIHQQNNRRNILRGRKSIEIQLSNRERNAVEAQRKHAAQQSEREVEPAYSTEHNLTEEQLVKRCHNRLGYRRSSPRLTSCLGSAQNGILFQFRQQ
jgi:hypothetical protein